MLFLSIVLIFTGSISSVKAKGFSDVPADTQSSDYISYLVNKNIIKGYDNNLFKPNKHVTRGDAALMIARALDLNIEKRDTDFTDVNRSIAASGAIQSAIKEGIINGYSDKTFRPSEVVTRGQMASFLARAFKLEYEEASTFTDVAISSTSYSDIRKVLAFGITNGYSDGEFKPGEPVTRAQFSAFLARGLNDEFRLTVYACGYDPASRVNPDRQTMNCLLTKAARESDAKIPPELLKALVSVEKNDWKHFTEDGEPVVSGDGGIGLMQITNTTGYDVERLKYDLLYNIKVGVEFLATNFTRTDLPKFVNHDPTKLEHWYFALMGYNGTKPKNSPLVKATGERNPTAYQEKVYQELGENGFLKTKIHSIEMTIDDFNYDPTSNKNIEFVKKTFNLSEAATSSKEILKVGDRITYFGAGLRSQPGKSGTLIMKPTITDELTIIGGPVYDDDVNSKNQFIWYPVKIDTNGKKYSGFIASPYIN